MATIDYPAEVRHDGRLHEFVAANLEIPICEACGEKVFTQEVDRQVNHALREYLVLLTPAQIRQGIERVGMTQKEVAERTGIAEATLSRWLNETQIQSRSTDNLLRIFFSAPRVRAMLCADARDPQFGLADVLVHHE